MKKKSSFGLLWALLSLSFCNACFSQGETPPDSASKATAVKGRVLPSVNVTTLDGGIFNTANINNNGKPIVINFWATWCSPCKRELNTIAEIYDEWKEKTGVKLIAVSIDDSRNMGKVKPYVDGQGWDFEVYIDPNSDLKRALNVNNVPHTFLLNGNNEIVWQHNSYSPGDEEHLFELIEKVAKGEPLEK